MLCSLYITFLFWDIVSYDMFPLCCQEGALHFCFWILPIINVPFALLGVYFILFYILPVMLIRSLLDLFYCESHLFCFHSFVFSVSGANYQQFPADSFMADSPHFLCINL